MGLGTGGTQVRKRGLAARFSQAGGEAVSPVLCGSLRREDVKQGRFSPLRAVLPGKIVLPSSLSFPTPVPAAPWTRGPQVWCVCLCPLRLLSSFRVLCGSAWTSGTVWCSEGSGPWPLGPRDKPQGHSLEEKFPIRWLRNVLEWREEKPPSQDAVCSGERAADCTGPCGVRGQLPDSRVGGTGVGPPAWVLSPDLTMSSLSFLQSLKLASALEKDLDTFQNKVERNLQGGKKE